MAALNLRRESMRLGIESLKAQLARDVPQLAAGFDPSRAVNELLGKHGLLPDCSGSSSAIPDSRTRFSSDGARGTLRRRRPAPSASAGLDTAPPPLRCCATG